jgi:hypothetical protein
MPSEKKEKRGMKTMRLFHRLRFFLFLFFFFCSLERGEFALGCPITPMLPCIKPPEKNTKEYNKKGAVLQCRESNIFFGPEFFLPFAYVGFFDIGRSRALKRGKIVEFFA